MNKMTGIILMALGLIILVIGTLIFLNPTKTPINEASATELKNIADEPKTIAEERKENGVDPKEDNLRKGHDFEKFVVTRFSKKYYTIKEWTSDKSVDGRFAETTLQPDMVLKLNLDSFSKELALECKWRQRLPKEGIEVATENQLKRYKRFEQEKGIPVFIVLGIGGLASSPKHLYTIPLREISHGFIPHDQLTKFERESTGSIFFNVKTGKLE
ncbi:hypothetical protein [Rufibacter roseolus]|uniref:hypothetical protein n=1 Tax=Rufibacter roseolus TaxID=2817375 RepID=UPI001B301D41|nr:hypothetical protein [Rufibacter roseolus]